MTLGEAFSDFGIWCFFFLIPYEHLVGQELFSKYDADRDQMLSEKEVQVFAKDLGIELSPEVGFRTRVGKAAGSHDVKPFHLRS